MRYGMRTRLLISLSIFCLVMFAPVGNAAFEITEILQWEVER